MPVTKPFVAVILGKSRAGKDTARVELTSSHPTTQEYKFSAPMKRSVEKAYGLIEGALELPEYREAHVPGKPEGYNFLDLMIAAYMHCDWICDNVWIPGIYREALHSLDMGMPVVFTDIRKLTEAYQVANLSYHASVPLYAIHVDRDVPAKASDHLLPELLAVFTHHATKFYNVDNNGTRGAFQANIYHIAKDF